MSNILSEPSPKSGKWVKGEWKNAPSTVIVNESETGHGLPEIFEYFEVDINGDGEIDDIVVAPTLKLCEYLIEVVPEPDALPTDTYSLEVEVKRRIFGVAEDVPLRDVLSHTHTIISTDT